jgi:hypothetical protein
VIRARLNEKQTHSPLPLVGEGQGRGKVPNYASPRFWNNEVMQQMEGVLERVRCTISLSPAPSPASGRGEMAQKDAS